MFSPFLRKPFKKAVEAGLIPPGLITMAGTYGTVHDNGDLTYLNLIHMGGYRRHRSGRPDPRRDRGPQAGDARDRGAARRTCPAARRRRCATSG